MIGRKSDQRRAVSQARARLTEFPPGIDARHDSERIQILRDIGFTLYGMGRYEEALEPLAEADGMLADRPSDRMPVEIRLRRISASVLLNRHREVLELTDPLLGSGVAQSQPSFLVGVHSARLLALTGLGRWTEVYEEGQALLDAAGPEAPPSLQSYIVDALASRARAARELGEPQLALSAADAALATARATPDEARGEGYRAALMTALGERAEALDALNRTDEARGAYGDLIEEYAGDADYKTRKVVWVARRRRLGLRLDRELGLARRRATADSDSSEG